MGKRIGERDGHGARDEFYGRIVPDDVLMGNGQKGAKVYPEEGRDLGGGLPVGDQVFVRGAHRGRPGCGPGHFFGVEIEAMSPKAQTATALAVLAPVVLSGLLLVALVPDLWWIFTYGWVAFPAFGLWLRGLAGSLPGTSENRARGASADDEERELLEALRSEGGLTPVRAAVGTSLSVAEADRMLKKLAEGGHLKVRAYGGGLLYALWDTDHGARWPEPDGKDPYGNRREEAAT